MDRTAQLMKFIEKDPDNPFPRYALALEKRSAGDLAGAIVELQSLLARKEDYVPACLMAGMLLEQAGRTAEAREVFTRGQGHARTQGNTKALSELTSFLERLP
jgi:predicted RNA polymerase sigma factor